MVQGPGSLPEFEAQFPDDEACARWLFERRWPDGFRCPGCGHAKGWEPGRGTLLVECARCRRQPSVTAGTVLPRSHLPLKLWFLAAWLVATHKNGMSARQLWLQLGLGSYKSAWLLLPELRRAMVAPEREPHAGLVEVDETSLPFRAGGEPAGPGRSHGGKLLVAGAVEIRGKRPGRIRLAVIGDCSAVALGAFVAAAIAAGSTVVSDGWPGYKKLKDVKHEPTVVGETPAHLVLPWVRRVFADAKRWASGVYHGLRRRTSRPTSTSSCSGSTAGTIPSPPSTVSSGSASPSSPPRTRCWSAGANGMSRSQDLAPSLSPPFSARLLVSDPADPALSSGRPHCGRGGLPASSHQKRHLSDGPTNCRLA